jgi:hypothetical protein
MLDKIIHQVADIKDQAGDIEKIAPNLSSEAMAVLVDELAHIGRELAEVVEVFTEVWI